MLLPQIAGPPAGSIPMPAPQVRKRAARVLAGTKRSPRNLLISPKSAVSRVSPAPQQHIASMGALLPCGYETCHLYKSRVKNAYNLEARWSDERFDRCLLQWEYEDASACRDSVPIYREYG